MLHEVVGALPAWFIRGAILGVVCSVCLVGLFVAADRYFPASNEPRDRTSGESRRRAEIRDYLDMIDEQYAEGHFVAGQHVAFYLPTRDVAITFDARAYFRIEHTETTPVLVEHELPGVSIGARLPFETPEVEFETEDEQADADPIRRAYAELGLPAGADEEEVKSAYRTRVKDVHPDQGGDEDAFKRVREAYTTAKQHAS